MVWKFLLKGDSNDQYDTAWTGEFFQNMCVVK